MHSRLAEILAGKQKEVQRLMNNRIAFENKKNPFPIRDFKGAISRSGMINLIAEIKFASPSAGIIRKNGDPRIIGPIYEETGVAAISCLTDRKFFTGDLGYLPQLKKTTSLPILRKDFIIDEIQVKESFLWGADAILLIARILSKQELKQFLDTCLKFGMGALTEVHDEDDLNMAVECGAEIIGINNRDLDTFNVDIKTSLKLAPLVPDGHIIVSESGINNRDDIQLLKQAGIQAVLVGTSIMKSDDIAKTTKDLVEAGR